MAEEKATLLIIEDDLDVADMLNAYFRVQGYEVMTASWGEDGVQTAKTIHPNLIILDIRLPDIDGYEVASRLRASRRTAEIPIIFLTERNQKVDRHRGLGLGADDYMTKPFDIQELRLRVRNALRRSAQGGLTNPITNLPDGSLVDETLTDLLASETPWAVVLVSLDHIEFFREAYGFVAADDALRAISVMVQSIGTKHGGAAPFVGHLSTNQFVLVTEPEKTAALEEKLGAQIKGSLDYFYPIGERGNDGEIPNRLTIRIGSLLSVENPPFKYLDTFKATLVRQLT